MNYLNLPIGSGFPGVVNAIIEVPGGQANKYEYDSDLHVFHLDRPLYGSVHYPGDYGFIPSTRSEDGDPLDILILLQDPTFSGCLIEARPIGVLEIIDQGEPDEKILAVAEKSPTHASVRQHTALEPHVLKEIEHFFTVYKQLEGKHTEVRGWSDVAHAHQLIRLSHKRFQPS
ncbi:MAG TPA: inorganic diphosphatase [Verrucomicrobiae bacterium]|jgi:inorganic pyrophosphatase|nr:inorganic diphosphatase [Verrucomicrobiae bacterium]